MSSCANGACHGGFPAADPRHFNTQGEAYTFALNRSIAGNPGGSLFLQKASGAVAHSGGTVWPNGSAAYNTAASWINTGRAP
jgi:hypothetical protein